MRYLFLRLFVPSGPNLADKNYFRDLVYSTCIGFSQSLLGAIAVVVVKQSLNGSNQLVGLIQAGAMAGLLMSLWYSYFVRRFPSPYAYGFPHILAWITILLAAFTQSATIFACLVFIALLALHISSPIQGVLYQEIYKSRDRGKIVGKIRLWQVIAAASSAWLIGSALEISQQAYWSYYVALSLVAIVALSFFVKIEIPSRSAFCHKSAEGSGFPNIVKIFQEDSAFFRFMCFQFILGIANLSGLTAFYIYVNDESYLGLDPKQAAIIAGFISPLTMFLSIPIWGRAFDKLNIVQYRVVTSAIIAGSFLLLPFYGVIGAWIFAAVWGVGRAGGQLAWSLGALDFAPEGRSRDYLSIHTFLTGVRGVIAPFIGIFALENWQGETETLFLGTGVLILVSAWGTYKLVPVPKART
ncbi:MAG: MFS transporter [Pseudobacteriovorax sp.]|nr:MFS transporter [Pseudobacteriovorax sp.]